MKVLDESDADDSGQLSCGEFEAAGVPTPIDRSHPAWPFVKDGNCDGACQQRLARRRVGVLRAVREPGANFYFRPSHSFNSRIAFEMSPSPREFAGLVPWCATTFLT